MDTGTVVILLLVVSAAHCWFHPHHHDSKEQDEIHQLPGLPSQPSFKHYSGYLNAKGTKKLHYWFVESQGDPKRDPLLLWLNGGPGCSSLDGLLTEHGPYLIDKDGKTLHYNDYSWNILASVLYIEAPAGVGYSYSSYGFYNTDDDEVAENNYVALQSFFKKFPECKRNDFYLTGESYAGVYIPTLTVKVLKDPNFNLKGMVIGNGMLAENLNENTKFYYWYYHGFLGVRYWRELMDTCCADVPLEDFCEFYPFKSRSCQKLISKAVVKMSTIPLNPYNIYDQCSDAPPASGSYMKRFSTLMSFLLKQTMTRFNDKQSYKDVNKALYTAKNGLPCIDTSATEAYMNRKDVRKALHIPYYLPKWTVCTSALASTSDKNSPYKQTHKDMTSEFLEVLKAKKRILVFNGDLDFMCNFLADQAFVDSLEQKELFPYKAWYYIETDNTTQVGGFGRQFENISFMTVKGAGHMVATDKPIPALTMMREWLDNKLF